MKLCERCEDKPAARYMWQNLPIMLVYVCESCVKDKNLYHTAEELMLRIVTKALT